MKGIASRGGLAGSSTGEWRGRVLWIVALLIGVFLAVPTLIVVPMSFSGTELLRFPPRGFSTEWYEELLTSPEWRSSAIASLKVAGLTVLAATVLGTVTALGIVRGRFPGRSVFAAAVLSPVIVPVVVVAIGMYFVFSDWGLTGTLPGLVMAHTVLALPLVVIAVATSARNLDQNLELAAQNLGAGPVKTFRFITLPLIMPGVVAGALFAFVTSWDEVVIASFLTSPTLLTLPVRMWTDVRLEISPVLAALASMLMAITVVLVVGGMLIARRQLRGGR